MNVRLLWVALAVFSVAYAGMIVWSLGLGLGDPPALFWVLVLVPSLVAAGSVLVWRRPRSPIGHLLLGAALAMFMVPSLLEIPTLVVFQDRGIESWMWVPLWGFNTLTMAGVVLISILIALLPDGRPRNARERRFVRGSWLITIFPTLYLITNDVVLTYEEAFAGLPDVPSPFPIRGLVPWGETIYVVGNGIAGMVFIGALLLQVMRYRKAPTRERKQVRWVIYAAALAITVVIAGTLLTASGLLPAGHNLVQGTVTAIAVFLLFGSIVIAILEPPWIDVDIVIRKSFVYGALSFLILLTYVGVAATFGVAAGSRLPIEIAVVLTVIVALLFQPARRRLQVVADRWVFGARPSKYEAVTEFGETIEQATDPSELLPQLVETIRNTLDLRWASAELDDGTSATTGDTQSLDPELSVPIGAGEEDFGLVECGPKAEGKLADDEKQLVRTLAGQVGLAVMNARLAGRIVTAAESERRRIERNIHDGAQQELVALVARLGMARAAAKQGHLNPTEIDDLQREARQILADLRSLAQGIHPSVLSDGGILEAVEERCSHLPLDVTVEASSGLRHRRYDDGIEGAAYFFVTESLTNVLKHAEATTAMVVMRAENSELRLSVSDDGHGFDESRTPLNGLAGLRDRVRALGGTLTITSSSATGTRVSARLPTGS